MEAYGFDLSVGLSYQLGGRIIDYGYQNYMDPGLTASLGKTWHKDMLNAWRPDNTNTDVPRMGTAGELVEYASQTSTRFLISSDYLSLNNITAGELRVDAHDGGRGHVGVEFEHLLLLVGRHVAVENLRVEVGA